jgi:putative ABC transport system permease protein
VTDVFRWLGRLWNVVRSGRLQRELDRELSFHLLERREELQASGMSRPEAERIARLQLGNYTLQKERTRDMDIQQWLESAFRNLRLAGRALAKSPAFTATVVLTLALGIGANSAVFSALYAVVLRPFPFPNPDRLVTLAQVNPRLKSPFIAPVRLRDWDRLNTTFQAIGGSYVQDSSELSGELPERLTHAFVSSRFLEAWGSAPALGRNFSRAEEHSGGPAVVLISDRFWRRRFNANPGVIGKQLRFAGWSPTIVGVMPASFLVPQRDVDVWSPSADDAGFAQNRTLTWYNGIGRLKPGVTIAQAQANLAAVQAELGRQYPKTDATLAAAVSSYKESATGGTRGSLWILFGSVTLLLLIACTNVAALLLSRSAARQQEISVRFSLGASRASVAAHLLSEVFLLAISGATLGLLLAGAAAQVFRSLARDLPRVDEITLDWRIALYSLGCSLVVTVLCGILPAMRGTRNRLANSVRGSRTTVSGRNRVQLALVGVQVALAVTLLAGAALLIRSFDELSRVSPGFAPENILTLQISSSWGETADLNASRQRVARVLESILAVPGVDMAAVTGMLPGIPSDFQVELKTQEGRAETEPKIITQTRVVSPGYFATMRIPLLSGELCREGTHQNTSMVNRAFANAYFAGSSPIGHHLVQPGNLYVPDTEVRGIVGDAREYGLDREPAPTIYWCAQSLQPGTHFLARTHGDPAAMAETLRRTLRTVEPSRSVFDLRPLADQISDAYAENRLRTILLAFFAVAAILLASIGLYGTISYVVQMRRREIGVRLALGAMRAQIAGTFVSQGLLVSGVGCLAGLVVALISTRLLQGMLYGVSATDPTTFAAVAVLALAVALLASLIPAVRAARLEPMQVLRED